LGLLDDDRAPLQHASGEFFDRSLRPVVGQGLDEGEAARPAALAVERQAHAAKLDTLSTKRLPKLLLGDVIRKISDKKPSTHPSLFVAVLRG
jgi:hypothetical protein